MALLRSTHLLLLGLLAVPAQLLGAPSEADDVDEVWEPFLRDEA